MQIKCPICGKEYHYDRKICQDCEDYSIYSGFTEVGDKNCHKWNCSIFLGIETIAFRVSDTCDLINNLSPEPRNLTSNERKVYDWNTEPINSLNRKKVRPPRKLTLGDYSTIRKFRSDTSLLYE
ncbi:MAG: hypothetical protein ACFFE4_04095 [Candidatus Thorarchaeota archaeon]